MVSAQWVSYSEDEVARLIVKLAKDGLQPAQIGLVLRDQYGIPSVKQAAKKTLTEVLADNQMLPSIPQDLFNLLRRAVRLRAHLERNKRDAHSIRGLELLESKVRRLVKYYCNVGKLPPDWKYDAERAKLIVEKGA